MSEIPSPLRPADSLLTVSAALNRAETTDSAIACAVELIETVFEDPTVRVDTYDSQGVIADESFTARETDADDTIDRAPATALDRPSAGGDDSDGDVPELTVDDDPPGSLCTEVFVPVSDTHVLSLGTATAGGFDESELAIVEGVAANLSATLTRLGRRERGGIDCDIASTLFEQSDRATFVSAPDGALIAVNDAMLELTGYEREELLSMALTDVIGADATAAIRDRIDGATAGPSGSVGTSLGCADGTERTVELTNGRIEVDESVYVRTTARDVSTLPGDEPVRRPAEGPAEAEATALRRLNELTTNTGEFDETIERLLALGCDHFGLETGRFAHVDGDDYEIEAAVDATGTHEAGAVYDLGDTMCQATLAGDTADSLAFADVADTEYSDSAAAENVGAYIAAPVVVDGETYGTVNFSMERARPAAFLPTDREFVKLVAQWIGTEVERRQRFAELERYETILEAVGDPMYALDAAGRFTFFNEAAKRELGYGPDIIGARPSVGMDDDDVEQIEAQIETLLTTDKRSTTAEFAVETADGDRVEVENQLAVIGDGEFRGTAGVLRDITDRKRRKRTLDSFKQAIEEAADGVAVLDDGTYTYVDRTHVEMYGFDDKAQLLGSSWRKLYDDAETERIESEAFTALEQDGQWRGMVTGTRPDGSTFPAELSLTIVDDGRLVCTVRDETERRARERELELKERAMDEATVGIQITDSTQTDNPLVYVNDGFERLTGYACEAALGQNPRFLQGADTDPETVDRLRAAIDAEEPISLELRNERRDGTPYWNRLSVTPVEDETGTVSNFIGIQQDVTERRERSRWLRQFLDRGPLLFVETHLVDDEPVIASCNDRFLARLGYDRDEIEGEPLASLYTDDSATELEAGGYEAALAGEFEMDERTLVDADGNRVHTLLRAVPRQGETTGTSALFVDISERKKRERRKDATVAVLEDGYEVTTDPSLSFEEKVDGLLAAGSEYLDLPYAFLTRIEADDGEPPGTQRIVQARGSHEKLQAGESCPLSQSYCRKTIESDDLVSVTQAGETAWADDPAYDTFELETYMGGAVETGGDTYGTLCFASSTPQGSSFTETERSVLNLFRRWVGYEIDRRQVRADRRDQRERLELVLSGTNTGLAEWDLQTDELSWNETLTDIVDQEITSADDFEAAVHPDDVDRVQTGLETMLETGEPWVGEFRMVGGDGDTVWIGTRAVPVDDDTGAPVRVLATASDITDRKEQERERRRNERRYRRLAENIPNGAVLTFDAALEYELAAGELLAEFDLAESDIAGTAVGTLFTNDEHDLVDRYRAALQGERTDRRIELGGRVLRVHIVPVDAVDDPTDTYGLVLAQDVTDESQRERELLEERERFRLLTESIDEYAFIAVDGDGDVQTWNDGARTMFGYDTETAVGMSVSALHTADNRESGLPERLLQQSRVAGESAHEGWAVRDDGTKFYADIRYAPLKPDDSDPHGYAVVVRDMTERRLQRRRTERFVEQSEDVVTIVDPDGTVTYVSGSAERVLGYDPDDVVGENLFDYLHPDSRERALETFYECVDGASDGKAECRLASPDGGWFTVEGRYRNMLDEEAIDGILVYLRDVTEIKKRTRRFESIFNGTFQFTGLLEPDGSVVEVNEAALEFGGVKRDAIVGDPFFDAPWWTHSEAVRDDVVDAIERAADGEFVRYETEVRGADGLATIDFSVKPVTDEAGEVSALVVGGRDITDRRQHRQHLSVMQRVMRHNMRNDLTKLRGWTEVMSNESDDAKRAEHFATVQAVLDKWESMTESIGEIRRVLESQTEQSARTEVGTLLEDAVAPLHAQYPAADIDVEVPDGSLPKLPRALLTAVRELGENAVEATDDATVAVAVTAAADGWIDITVSDDGPGMPEMEAEVLTTGEETPLNHGQGLGLWMVRMVVTQAGGQISVASTDDGTDVCLRLPADRVDEVTTAHERR